MYEPLFILSKPIATSTTASFSGQPSITTSSAVSGFAHQQDQAQQQAREVSNSMNVSLAATMTPPAPVTTTARTHSVVEPATMHCAYAVSWSVDVHHLDSCDDIITASESPPPPSSSSSAVLISFTDERGEVLDCSSTTVSNRTSATVVQAVWRKVNTLTCALGGGEVQWRVIIGKFGDLTQSEYDGMCDMRVRVMRI
jgi:hypothetical protein